jgi:hypothetical protein
MVNLSAQTADFAPSLARPRCSPGTKGMGPKTLEKRLFASLTPVTLVAGSQRGSSWFFARRQGGVQDGSRAFSSTWQKSLYAAQIGASSSASVMHLRKQPRFGCSRRRVSAGG